MTTVATMADAIRSALDKLGVEAAQKDVAAYIVREFPALTEKTRLTSFASAISTQRRRLKGEAGDSGLFNVKEIVAPAGTASVEQIPAIVEKVREQRAEAMPKTTLADQVRQLVQLVGPVEAKAILAGMVDRA